MYGNFCLAKERGNLITKAQVTQNEESFEKVALYSSNLLLN